MITKLSFYPAMKNSVIPWLGDMPEHWHSKPLKHWVKMNAAVLPETTPPGYEFRYLDIGSVGTGVLTQKPQRLRFETAPSRARRMLRKGDTIVSTVRTYLKAIYFVEEEVDDLICSTGFAVLTPRAGTIPKFVSYLVQSHSFTDLVTADSVGIAYPAIPETRLGSYHVAVPPLAEQAAIVRFLDYANRRILLYIRAKQKLIKLLEEQTQAIVHRTVTRGLDPKIRLKPSGVEWLGDIPEHWEVLRSRYLFREVDKRSETGAETHLSMSQRLGLVPSSMVEQRTLVSQSYAGGKLCDEDDLVLNRLKAHLGVFALARQSGVISPDYTVLRKIRPMAVQYFEHVLRSPACRVELRMRAKGIVEGFWRLYTDDFYDIRLPVPPESEQQEIVDALNVTTKTIRAAIQRTESEIALLRQYRTRLITDVVTGKLDVRETATMLPDEGAIIDEPEEAGELMDVEDIEMVPGEEVGSDE